MKTELETRSSQLVDDAGSKNYLFSIFLSKLAFLSSASMKLKGTKIRKKRKRKNILCSHVLKEDVKTTRVSITFSIQITLLVYNCLLPKK